MLKLTDSNLESQPWKIVNDTSVNPVPVDSILEEEIGNALEVFISASKPYGGALVYTPRPVPLINGNPLAYVGMDMEIYLPDEAAQFLRCLETDLKISLLSPPAGGTAQNLVDFSSQVELFNNGNLQIDNGAGSWTDAGFTLGALPVDTWFPWSARYQIDVPNKKFSVLSFSITSKTFAIPAALQGIPWHTTNWVQTAHPQLQLDDNTTAAAMFVKYRNISLTWCDQPF